MSEAIGTREFAEKYGVTQATVSKWCREGKIPNCNQDGKGSRGIFPRMQFHQLDISKGKSDIGKEQLMDQELFNPQSSSVSSSRIIYTPSTFARTSLLHLQEVGSLQAVHPHISQREDLVSFLCFIVLSGEGELSYEEQTYQLGEGDCVFVDCRKAYSHSTSDNLWSL